jgi:citrate lyase subunit beta/citryl-CoA lyase
VAVESSVKPLFGRAIEAAARAAAAEFCVATGELRIDDDGALDFVIGARVEAALRAAGFARAADIKAGASTDGRNTAQVLLDRRLGRRRRSRLYLPGDQPDLLPNAGLFGADCLILDLEDSVAPSRKAEARILARRVLETHRDFFGTSEIVVRINPLAGSFGLDDLSELAGCLPDAILLPKCESAGDVEALAAELDRIENAAGVERGRTLVMAIVETARGVIAAPAIAAASNRISALSFGAEDFSRDVGARRTASGSESLTARQNVVMAARSAGVQAHDSVYSDVDDEAGLTAYCAASRALGFDGVGLVHPRQIADAHAAFSPSTAELDEARRIVGALDAALAQGLGVVSLDGRMVDAPVAERARRLVGLAAGAPDDEKGT